MKSYLEVNCDPDDWLRLPEGEKLIHKLRSSVDPVYFWNHPKLGNFPLFQSKIDIFKEFYAYNDVDRRINNELIFSGGMRSGKTAMAGLISLTETYKLLMMKNPQEHYKLIAGTEIFNINVANALEQAKDTVFRKVKEIVSNSPYFVSQDPYLTATALKFPKSITFKALGSNLGSNVGRTVKCFVADEIATYDDPEGVYDKLSRSTSNFESWNENIKVMIGSPTDPADILMTRIQRAREEKWPNTVTVWRPTWELNPNIPYNEEERARNPIAYDRDMGANPTAIKESLFNPTLLKAIEKLSKTHSNLFLGLPDYRDKWNFTPTIDFSKLKAPLDYVEGVITLDPSIKHDAFGLSVQYLSTEDIVKTIGSTIFTAPRGDEIKTETIADIIRPICKVLPISTLIFDIYMHSQLHDVVTDYGISVEQHNLDMSDWIFTRNDLYDGKAEIPYSEYLFKELRELLVVKAKKVDHPRMGSKDQADSIAQGISFFRRRQEEARLKSQGSITNLVASF